MNKSAHIILWLLSLTFFFSSWLLYEVKPSFIFESLDVDKIESEIQSIIDKAEVDENLEIILEPSCFDYTKISHEDNKTYEYVVVDSDSIKYWTTNKIDFKKLIKIQQLGIYNLSSRIYLLWKKEKQEKEVFILIPLKNNFNIENSYLQNTSFSQLNFPKNYKPSSSESPFVFHVNIQDKDFVFYFEQIEDDEIALFWELIILLTFFVSLISLVLLIYRAINKSGAILYYWKIAIWVLSMSLLYLLFVFQIPFVQELSLFQPYSFANAYIPSFGFLIINIVWGYIVLFYALSFWVKVSPHFNFWQSLFAQLIAFGFLLSVIFFIHYIMINSTSNFADLENLILHYQDILFLLVFGTLILLFIKFLLFILRHTEAISPKLFWKYIIFLYVPLFLAFLFFDWHFIILPVYVVISGLFISLKPNVYFSKQTVRLSLIFIGSVFIVSIVEFVSSEKELENSSLRLGNYQIENDRLAEYLIKELDQKIVQDSILLSLIYHLPETQQKIYDYIPMQYITGFWSQYQSDITVCGTVFFRPNDICSCDSFFDPRIEKAVKVISNSHFVIIQDYGINNYLGKFSFASTKDSTLIDLYIHLKPKEQNKNLGYPSILLSKEVGAKDNQAYYSFAKYVRGDLMSHTGEYNYKSKYIPKNDNSQSIRVEDGYKHLIEKQSRHIYNFISIKQKSAWDFFVILSYIFILYIIVFYSFEILSLIFQSKLILQNSLKDKLRFSFLGLLFVSFSAIAWATISESTSLSAQKQENVLEEKMQSVLVELKHKLLQSEHISDIDQDYLNYLLIKFSNVFFTDINLFDLSGKLIASSRLEVFEKGLIGDRINPDAFDALVGQDKREIIHNESIGEQIYLSAYIPIKNPENQIIAYLNLPYFGKDKELKSDISILVTTFLNIFVILFLVTGLFTIFLSNRITLPLANIQNKLKSFSLGERNEPIVYKSKDEIGALVSQYNKTVEELNKNIELLAQKERESAWKEMAKQIAHEIKNPLTPMKLSIQHLKYVWKDDKPDKDKKINATVDLIVKQIDNLAEIATAFSDFSKMTIAKKVTFNLIHLIQDQVDLHSKEVQISIIANESYSYDVYADEQQISRVFQNIITNAIQSIPEGRTPKITIQITLQENLIHTQICDNGLGMDSETQKRLFEPNFTTKNSGMGLGLAIVKQIVENNKGSINFETQKDKGTCFFLVLPRT